MSSNKTFPIDYASEEFGAWTETCYAQEISEMKISSSCTSSSLATDSNGTSEQHTDLSDKSSLIEMSGGSKFTVLGNNILANSDVNCSVVQEDVDADNAQQEFLKSETTQNIFKVLRERITITPKAVVFKSTLSVNAAEEQAISSLGDPSFKKQASRDVDDSLQAIQSEFLLIADFAQHIAGGSSMESQARNLESQVELATDPTTRDFQTDQVVNEQVAISSSQESRKQATEIFRAARKLFV